MVYAMLSIGLLGFIVWSFFMMALPSQRSCDEVINFAICWNSLVLISTLNSQNLINYTQSAGKYQVITFSMIIPQRLHAKNLILILIGFTENDGVLLN